MTTKRVSVRVTGRVQGVFFRASTRDEAVRLGVRGWVRNLDDGGVEFVAEGDATAVDALLAWARRGPPNARVDGLVVTDAPAAEELVGFDVRR